jgi:hypothetical protein
MVFRRMFTAVLVAASAVLAAPAAYAEPEPAVIESANGTEQVWQQTRWDGYPTITDYFSDGPNQYWLFRSNGTIKNVGTQLCAEAVDRRIVGQPCDLDDPGQRWTVRGEHNQKQLRNEKYGNCATYEGHEQQLLVRECDPDRVNQRWYLNY